MLSSLFLSEALTLSIPMLGDARQVVAETAPMLSDTRLMVFNLFEVYSIY
jgi:hypothetical protein